MVFHFVKEFILIERKMARWIIFVFARFIATQIVLCSAVVFRYSSPLAQNTLNTFDEISALKKFRLVYYRKFYFM